MKTRFITFLLLFVMNLGAFAQSPYQPAEESPSGAFKRQSGLAQQDGGALPRQARRDLR